MDSSQVPIEPTHSIPPPTPIASPPILEKTKPIWQTDAFTVLVLLVISPIGLILMWKYTSWRTWVKVLLSLFFLVGFIPYLLFWGLILGVKGFSLYESFAHPKIANQSKNFQCTPMSDQWGKCRSMTTGVAFEYPVNWTYFDIGSDGIGLNPTAEHISDTTVISFSGPDEWKDAETAANFANGFSKVTVGDLYTIHGIHAKKNYIAFTGDRFSATVILVDGKKTYEFSAYPKAFVKYTVPSSQYDFQALFDHMAESFILEK